MNSNMAEYLDDREIATLGLHTTANDYETSHEVRTQKVYKTLSFLATHLERLGLKLEQIISIF